MFRNAATPSCFPTQEEAKLGNPILRDRHPRAHGKPRASLQPQQGVEL